MKNNLIQKRSLNASATTDEHRYTQNYKQLNHEDTKDTERTRMTISRKGAVQILLEPQMNAEPEKAKPRRHEGHEETQIITTKTNY
jgi:hypothetical protein